MWMLRLLPLLLLFAASEPALALRCGSKLVNDGDHKAKVLKHCGEPVAIEVRRIVRGGLLHRHADQRASGIARPRESLLAHQPVYVEVIIEEWTYNFGPRKLMRVISFENGLVRGIRQLGYGYRN